MTAISADDGWFALKSQTIASVLQLIGLNIKKACNQITEALWCHVNIVPK